ncbi:adenylosuccinate synthase [Bacteroidota bacterium]|nr:adenylosuccinate synthase [Bacteroidota bacterium]
MFVDLLLGLQWGDEGKGKIVDAISKGYSIISRFQGGPNAGHTIKIGDKSHVLHTIPSGIFHKNLINIIGNGVVIDPIIFKEEVLKLSNRDIDISNKLLISKKAHLIIPTHCLLDQASEKSKGIKKIGSTLKGIGPTYMDKTGRNGIRVGDLFLDGWEVQYGKLKNKHLKMIANLNADISFDLDELELKFFESLNFIKKMSFIDSENFLFDSLKKGEKILAEGAQGSMLDIDFGTYPFVTSSNTTASGACNGLGISPKKINKVIGVFKAYTTRVGSGPFPSEISDEISEKISKVGKEFGATTGRPRRCGWLDLVSLKYAVDINGVTELAMMKSDVMSGIDKIKVCTSYEQYGKEISRMPFSLNSGNLKPIYTEFNGWQEDITKAKNESQLPENLKKYISFIEEKLEVPVKIISLGPGRDQTIFR